MSHSVPDPHGPGPRLEDLTWREFERAMAVAFEAQGYRTTITADGADGGVDLVLRRPGEMILVQCKHWNAWTVGVKTVRELLGVMTVQQATGGIVAISGRFTDEARQFARRAGITLLARPEVVAMLRAAPLRFSDGAGPTASQDPRMGGPRCPRCGEPMAVRTANRGPRRGERFWGCPRFPHCRGIAPFAGPGPQAATMAQAGPHAGPTSWSRASRPKPGSPTARRLLVGALVAAAALLLMPGLVFAAWASMVRSVAGPITVPIYGQTTSSYPTAVPGDVQPTTARSTDPRIVASIQLPVSGSKVAADPTLQRLYVTAVETKSLLIVDLASRMVIATVALDRQPGEIAVDPTSHQLWVTNYNDASVTILDREGKNVAVLSVGSGPAGVAIDPGLHRAYVSNQLDNTVSTFDSGTRRAIATTKVIGAFGAVAVDTVTHQVCFVTEWMIPYCYDTSWHLLGYLHATGSSIAIDSVTHSHFATSPGSALLSVADGVTGKKSTVPLGGTPTGVAVDPSAHLVYVADHDSKTVLVIKPL